MIEGRRRPDRLPELMAAHRAALQRARESHPGPAVLIGKSMGSRIGCHVSLEENVDALVCFGYPLCGGGDPTKLRDQVLREITTPILFVQGTRDSLCPLELLESVRAQMRAANQLHVVEGGDHSLLVTKSRLRADNETQDEVDQRILEAIIRFIADHVVAGRTKMSQKEKIDVDGRELAISNVEKVFFPESGFTKGQVIAFYSEIADVIIPHLRDRPLTMKRYPEGISGEPFYEKNAPKHTPAWVKRFAVPRSEGGPDIQYILCNDRATLIWAANLADIEKHVLLARVPELNHPTAVVFDLDPGEPAGIIECGGVALHLRDLFAAWGLQSFVKVSGSKGLHLSVPLNSGATYEMTQPFAKAVAELVAKEMPQRVVSAMPKNLRTGKVLIDWSQNSDFKTTVCVYSMRAKSEQPFVSMPVTWDELAKAVKRGDEKRLFFTPAESIKRIRKLGDLFEATLSLKQRLPVAFTKALAAGPAPRLASWPKNRDKSLREYTAKRDLTKTPEPAARVAAKASESKGHHRFVIQKHAASHLHYDWRLEMQGVLRSWAVPKGPPMALKEARLAMHVEDHPLEYEKFEGTIPPGNYGAGTVMVWDYGVYDDITGNAAAAFHSGKMHIVMQGQKLKGEWILVKDKREPESNKWLLIKAGESLPPISAKMDDTSAISRSIDGGDCEGERRAMAEPPSGGESG